MLFIICRAKRVKGAVLFREVNCNACTLVFFSMPYPNVCTVQRKWTKIDINKRKTPLAPEPFTEEICVLHEEYRTLLEESVFSHFQCLLNLYDNISAVFVAIIALVDNAMFVLSLHVLVGNHGRHHIWSAAWQGRGAQRLEELSEYGTGQSITALFA